MLARTQQGGEYVLSRLDAEQLAGRWGRAEQERLEKSGQFADGACLRSNVVLRDEVWRGGASNLRDAAGSVARGYGSMPLSKMASELAKFPALRLPARL